jgi:SPP1 family predicted phage head-tail adaptor
MARSYCAGDLDQRIIVEQRAAATQNGLGENTSPWTLLATLWAYAEPLRGREFFSAAQQQQVTDVRFVVRYRADISAAMRVLWRGVYHDIQSAIHVDGAKTWLELMTVAGVRDGK